MSCLVYERTLPWTLIMDHTVGRHRKKEVLHNKKKQRERKGLSSMYIMLLSSGPSRALSYSIININVIMCTRVLTARAEVLSAGAISQSSEQRMGHHGAWGMGQAWSTLTGRQAGRLAGRQGGFWGPQSGRWAGNLTFMASEAREGRRNGLTRDFNAHADK